MKKKLFNDSTIELIRLDYQSGMKVKIIAKNYGTSSTRISQLVKDIFREGKRIHRIDDDIAKSILYEYMNGRTTQVELAKKYNCHQSTISDLIRGKTHRHLFSDNSNSEILSLL